MRYPPSTKHRAESSRLQCCNLELTSSQLNVISDHSFSFVFTQQSMGALPKHTAALVRSQLPQVMACRQRLYHGASRLVATSSPSRLRPLRSTFARQSALSLSQRSLFSTSSIQNAETIVKVPQMAESISEGTLSSFTKQPGDYVEQDEEIASIETDKVSTAFWSLFKFLLIGICRSMFLLTRLRLEQSKNSWLVKAILSR